MKIILNKDYGGFGLSQKVYERLIELGMKVSKERNPDELYIYEETSTEKVDLYGRYHLFWSKDMRSNPLLIQVIEELGDVANDELSHIEIVEIPDDVEYEIADYDGIETVHELHRSW